MRITRLYHNENLICGKTAQLDKNTSSHLVRVLRTKAETPVILFNGDGFDYLCKTLNNHPKKTLLAVESKIKINNESNLFITLIQGLSRLDRMETTIQKSVELGVTSITPLITERSVVQLNGDRGEKKRTHWQKIAQGASEQCGRTIVPEIGEIITLEKWLAKELNGLQLFFDPRAERSLKQISYTSESVTILSGPEGGFSNQERCLAAQAGYLSVTLGPRILRAETACIAAITAIQLLWGDLAS